MFNNGFIVVAKICKCIDDWQHFHSELGQSVFYFGWVLVIITAVGKSIIDHLS